MDKDGVGMRSIIGNASERVYLFARISLVMNMALTIGKILIGVFTASLFMYVNAFYSVGIGVTKLLFVRNYRAEKSLEEQRRCYSTIGSVILISSVVYIVYSLRLVFGTSSMRYSQIVAISIAAVTFTEIGMNIRGAVVAHRNNTPLVQAVKLANLASSLICLALTQTALLSFTTEQDLSTANGVMGILMGICSACIGVFMILRMKKDAVKSPAA